MRSFFLLVFILYSLNLFSQKKDSIRSVQILGYREPIKPEPITTLDSNQISYHKFQNLQQILELHSNLFIRNQGVGGAATISVRGASAAQTQFQWNGIFINNAQTGLSDISQFPNSFFNQIQIQTSAIENNVIGGLIKLENRKPLFQKQLGANIGLGYESLNNKMLQAGLHFGNPKIRVNMRYTTSNNQNRFNFYNQRSETTEAMQHAETKQRSIIGDVYIKPTKGNALLSVHSWLQLTDRNIPAAVFENQSKRSDSSISFRNVISYQTKVCALDLHAQIGYIHDRYYYNDSSIFLYSRAASMQIPSSISLECKGYRHRINIKAANAYAKLDESTHFTNNTLLNATFEIEPRRMNLAVKTFVQKEFSNLFELPFIAGLSLRKKLFKVHSIFASLNSSYRAPTLNELFFQPGGNINLKPEQSKNFNIGMEQRIWRQRYELKLQNEWYFRQVKDWIVWYGGAILTPHNLAEVHSRGIESSLSYNYKLKQPVQQNTIDIIILEDENRNRGSIYQTPQLNTQILYSYTLATTQKSYIPNDYSIGKQIPYVPRYQLRAIVGYSARNLRIDYAYHYTGYRFVTTDESQYLIPFNTHHLLAYYRLWLSNTIKCDFNLKVNNLLNQYYEGVVGRPQAGRSVLIGLTTSWN